MIDLRKMNDRGHKELNHTNKEITQFN